MKSKGNIQYVSTADADKSHGTIGRDADYYFGTDVDAPVHLAGFRKSAAHRKDNAPRDNGSRRLDNLRVIELLTIRVWELLDCESPIDEIAGVIAREFRVPRKLAHEVTRSLMRMYGEADMVSVTR